MKIIRFSLLALTAALSLVSCKKDGGDNDEDFPFYFKATVNGSNINWEADDISSEFECGISQPEASVGTDFDIYQGTVIQDGFNPSGSAVYVHILKFFSTYPSYDQKVAMVTTGSYPYGKSDVSPSTINGATIRYQDAAGNTWDSELGPQTGSTFNITELTDNPFGTSGKIFKANFSCKLYDMGGNSIQVSNATIRGKVFLP